MSWESISSRDYLGGSASHQLSATALLGSPDGSRHPLDVCEFTEEDYRHQNGSGNSHYQHSRPGTGLWECLVGCRRRLDQQLARRRVEQGLKLYRAHKQQAAVRKWRGALKSIRQREDKFALLGYLYQAYMDWGKYRIFLRTKDACAMNVLKATEELFYRCACDAVQLFSKKLYRDSIDFGQRQLCISEELDSPNMRAEAYLNLARAHERLGALDRALDYARHSLYNECDQCATAGLVHLTVGRVHLELAGFCKALEAFQRAHKIAHSIQDPSLELQKAFRQYESAMGSAAATGDRLCQMEAMDGVARCFEALRLQHKICNCRPLEFNTRLLEVAGSVGAKLLVRTVRSRLSRIYGSLGDEEQKGHHERLAATMEEDLELRCGGCNEPFGLEADSLEALPCSHILHARCAYDILKKRDKKKKRLCPDCHKSVSSRLYLHCEDPHGMNTLNHSSLSLASLRASSLATLEDCHATSSV
ncbi:43 kDa receptor-associated protein of the synapse homolog isoform X6 [Vespa crabro]|uniref:43 kDa receptor-associated protein of the synapse homolog isoform X6 n=1 Tax=Vespa crabro TaxID=7445 RepID=UPI001F027D7C|nr:43 kDa receptor-associated protein of the synapse homolog isoform X6 [Vespa crabro]